MLRVKNPEGGVVSRTAFQSQAPYTCYDALNFWPVDAKTGRRRMATRPGFGSLTSPASQINMLAELTLAPSNTQKRQPMLGTGGTLYRWTGAAWSAVGASNVDTGRNVEAVSINQKLYILNETLAYKVYNYSGHSVGTWTATTGTIPDDCLIGCEWDGRIVLTGDPDSPHVLSMSRQDDPDDWDFAAAEDDTAGAFQISINEPITALVPHNRDCLLIGLRYGWQVLRGNPRQGGTREIIPTPVGPINSTAHCRSADGYLYFLSRDGLYRMPPGCGDPAQSVSRERIPESLLAVDGVNNVAFLAYDVRFRGIHIYVEGTDPEAWWFDIEGEGFWPITVPSGTVQALRHYGMFETTDASGVAVGVTGLKRFDRSASLEADADAFIKLGPLNLESSTGQKSLIQEANVTFGDNTTDDDGTITFYTAPSGEEVIALPTGRKKSKGIANLIANRGRCFPRVGGNAALIHVLLDDPANHISIDGIDLYLLRTGKER